MGEPGGYTAFFYGTLMAPVVLHRVIYGTSNCTQAEKDRLTITPAVLHHYCRYKVRGVDYPGIVPEQDKSVRGSYVTGLSRSNILNLDVFEGGQYDRSKVEVELVEGPDKGKKVEAETYVWTCGAERLENEEWSIEEFKRDKMRFWTDESDEYADLDDPVREAADQEKNKAVDKELDTQKEVWNSAT